MSSSTTTDTTLSTDLAEAVADQNRTGLADVISQMAEDKSGYWSSEITALTAVEKELLAAREDLETYRVNIGSLNSLVAMSRYARLGKYTAAMLGSREEWDSNEITSDISTMWSRMDSRNIGGQSDEELLYWRRIADDLGIQHDGEDDAAPGAVDHIYQEHKVGGGTTEWPCWCPRGFGHGGSTPAPRYLKPRNTHASPALASEPANDSETK